MWRLISAVADNVFARALAPAGIAAQTGGKSVGWIMKPYIFLALAPLTVTACNDPGFTGVTGVQDALPSQVTNCTYITDIRMTPGVYGPGLRDRALVYARNKVLADAKDAGGNTVVFAAAPEEGEIYLIEAKAYRC